MIIISGTFKCGSTSLYHSLTPVISDIFKTHIWFSHQKIVEKFGDQDYVYLIPIRNQKEIYPSAMFEDIHNPSFEYSLSLLQSDQDRLLFSQKGKDALIERYQNLKGKDALVYQNFKTTDWTKYFHLNNSSIVKFVQQLDRSFLTIPFQIGGYWIVDIKGVRFAFIDTQMLSDLDKINQLLTDLDLPTISKVVRDNIGTEKFYSAEYQVLTDRLRSEGYFDQNYYDFLATNLYTIIA